MLVNYGSKRQAMSMSCHFLAGVIKLEEQLMQVVQIFYV